MEKLIITPRTKIFDLLEAYPQLEDLLIRMAPPFKKLKNPILRKTITKITTLSQAAVIGSIKVEELINSLRNEVGQALHSTIADNDSNYNTQQPLWFNMSGISQSIDIRQILNSGEQPVHEVMALMKKMKASEILKVTAPFIPAPLIDKSLSLQYKHWIDKKGDEEFIVYFYCQPK